jgi:histidine triad (HIT) family protein
VVDCLFCRIVAGELPADIVYQDAEAIAFRDIQPQAPSHVLVLPREHVSGLDAAVSMRADALGGLFQVAARVAEQEGLADRGYRVVVNTGPDAQQSVGHLHIHVIGGRQMGWPPG